MTAKATDTVKGLLARAKLIRIQDGDDLLLTDESGISAEKKQEILKQIERIMARSRSPVTPQILELKPTKKGFLFPLVVNAVAVLVLAAGATLLTLSFGSRRAGLERQAAGYSSAEGRLLEELKRESQEKLQQKESEIAGFQQRLQELDSEREDFRKGLEDGVRRRETELRQALQEELAAERGRLQAQGASATDIERRLGDLEEQQSARFRREVEVLQGELADSLAQKEREIEQARQALSDTLGQARAERERLQAEAAGRDDQLAALRERSSQAELQLTRLAELRQREQLYTDQILGLYSAALGQIEAADFSSAQDSLRSLVGLLEDPVVDQLPAVSRRRRIDLVVVEALRDLIHSETGGAGGPEALEAARGVVRVRELVGRADRLFAQGRLSEARQSYGQALQELPEISRAWSAVRGIEATEEASLITGYLERGRELLNGGRVAEALTQYGSAVRVLSAENRVLGEQVLEGMDRSYSERQAARMRELQEALELRLASGEEALTRIREELQARDREVGRLQAETVRLQAFREEIRTLQVRYGEARQAIAGLLAGTGSDGQPGYREAQRRLRQVFSTETAEEIFPSLPAVLEEIDAATLRSGAGREEARGRESAFGDVVLLINYLAGLNSGQEAETEAVILRKAREDALYRTVVEEVQALLARGTEQERVATTPFKLYGTVSLVTAEGINIEPLVDLTVREGDTLLLKRMQETGVELIIAQGVLSRTSGGRVQARLGTVFRRSLPPAVMDMVYIQQEAGR